MRPISTVSFEDPPSRKEATRWQARLQSGALDVPEPHRSKLLAWLAEILALPETEAQPGGKGG